MKWFHWAICTAVPAIATVATGLLTAGVLPAAAAGVVSLVSVVSGVLVHSPLATATAPK